MMITPNLIFLFTRSSLLILSLQHLFQTCNANCIPSACGVIRNISSPFRLKGDPNNCGDRIFELACENNIASIYFNSHKFYVKAINYGNSTVRLVDASLNNDDICSFPIYSFYEPQVRLHLPYFHYLGEALPINFMSCPNPLKDSSYFTDITIECASNSSPPTPRYDYIKVGHMNASELPHTCGLDLIALTSWIFKDLNNVSLSEIHRSLLHGIELNFCTWCTPLLTKWERYRDMFLVYLSILLAIVVILLAVFSFPVPTMVGLGLITMFALALSPSDFKQSQTLSYLLGVAGLLICVPKLIVCPLAIWFLIYKCRTRHLSAYEAIESFLQSDNKLTPIRYSFSHITKMTHNFQDKLGEGGYGSVYKGKLRSGPHVAVKLLGKSGASGQDFMNEITTIGRIHHVNVVKLVGYFAQGSKHTLVYDFMPNGSLEKYLFKSEKTVSLNWDTKFEIAVGVARGIEYLHRGCDVQILHFDIKPHNILLDDNFIPKISDFGLAKFCSIEKKTVSMTAARGTIGYVAPELINRSIGAVSYKADVYSFGMLLVEMVGLKRDLIGHHGDSSKYFPYWIYDCFNQGKDIEIGNPDENDDNDVPRKLVWKMTIVALWCIQMSPDDRPSMNTVLEMLDADVEFLQIPEYPSQSAAQVVVEVDEAGTTCSTDSLSLNNIGLAVEDLQQ